MSRTTRGLAISGLAICLMALLTGAVAAHTGEGVSLEHVIFELGTWALGVVAVIGVVVAFFWVRARASRR